MRDNIRAMFDSAVLKLTGWYLALIILVSMMFSVAIYYSWSSQITVRLTTFQTRIQDAPIQFPTDFDFRQIRERQTTEAKAALAVALFYANIAILVAGGFGSYLLARRTLRPIEEAHDAQARFTSDASHELRTPLAIMRSELEVAMRDPALSKADLRDILQSNLEEVNRLSELASTLLHLSRSQEDALDFTKFDVHEVIQEAMRAERPGKRTVSYALAKKPLRIRAHQPSIRELLTIVLDNAVRYSPEKGTIHIATRLSPTHAHLMISNDGNGISSKDLPHIFERFYRGDRSRSQQGYGLGLALAKKLVELHRGTISASSTPDGVTTVSISLPKS